MASIQLNFALRTSPNCRTVHLIGNWDGYKGQLPLSKDSSKPGAWKGTFRFQGSTLKPGTRYWYYYIMDGHHVSHDPARPFTTEPTTGRKLNILDVPASNEKAAPDPRSHRRQSQNVAKGRPISPSRIVSPKPVKPSTTVETLTRQLATTSVSDRESSDSEIDSDSESDSDVGSDVPSLSSGSSRSSHCSSPSSDLSSGSNCSCNRYGITRKGERVLLDCGGARCGGGGGTSEDSCSDSESDPEVEQVPTRRQGVVVRPNR